MTSGQIILHTMLNSKNPPNSGALALEIENALRAAEPDTADREMIAQAIAGHWGKKQDPEDDALAEFSMGLALELADAVIASGAIVPANKVRADAWNEAISAAAWTLANGSDSELDALLYTQNHNPYSAAELLGDN